MINEHFNERAYMLFRPSNEKATENDGVYLKYLEGMDYWQVVCKDHPSGIFKNIPVLNIYANKNGIIINTTNILMGDELKITINNNGDIEDIASEWCTGITKSKDNVKVLRLFCITSNTYVYFADIDVNLNKGLFYITVYGHNIDCLIKSKYHESMFETKHFSLEITL